MLAGKRILFLISGGIAAYKALDLIRDLRRAGAEITPVLTKAAQQFLTPLSVAALSGSRVYTDLFDLTDEAEMGHISLSRSADLLLVCPASADFLAKMAMGLADDLATTLLLATDTPVMVAPAMNVRMWEHPATKLNIARLKARGVKLLEPASGDMACGEFGPGRLMEGAEILAAIQQHFAEALPKGLLSGRHVLLTAGPTHEPIDPVRYIANRSSGKQGYALAEAFSKAGAVVTLVSGPVALPAPLGVKRVMVETAAEMAAAVEAALPADIAVLVAAVADWRVEPVAHKIKKSAGSAPSLHFLENPDILAGLCRHKNRPKLVVGFAAETEQLLKHAIAKLHKKGADLIVANDVSGDVMGGSRNQVHLVEKDSVSSLPEGSKSDVAQQLVLKMAGLFHGNG